MKKAYHLWMLLLLWGTATTAPAQQFDATHMYQLFNRNSNLPLDIIGGSYAEGAGAQQIGDNGTAAQQWRLIKYNTDPNSRVYWIVNRGSGKALELSGAQDADGVRVTQTSQADTPAQLWSIIPRTPGVPLDGYTIRTQVGNRTLEIENNSTAYNARAQVWTYANLASQEWNIYDGSSLYHQPYARWGVFRIRNVNSGKVLEVNNGTSTTGEPVQQWADEGFTHQLWFFQQPYTNNYPYGRILNRNSGLALEIENDSPYDGALAQQGAPVGGDGQLWSLEVYNSSADLVIIRNIDGKVLEIDGSSSANGARAQQWSRDVNAPGQIWKLEYVSYSRNAAPGVAAATTELAPDALAKSAAPEAAKVALSLYPNPAREALTISFGSLTKPAATISDVRGRTQPARYRADGRVDLSDLAQGVYILTVRDGQREYRQRFVKE